MCEMRCDEEKATEEEKEKAAGAELKTKTPHKDVGKKQPGIKPHEMCVGISGCPIQ